MFSEHFIVQLRNFLRSRGFLRNNNKNLFDEEMRQALVEFQGHKRLGVTDGNLTLETFRALGKELSSTQVNFMTKFDPAVKRFFIPQDIIEGIYVTGEKSEDREKMLTIFKNMMGDERMKYVGFRAASVPGMGDVIRIASSENSASKMRGIGDDDDNRFFSNVMADILSSNQIVEIQLRSDLITFHGIAWVPFFGRTNFGLATKSVKGEYGGGCTLNKDESLTGNVQIYIHPDGPNKAYFNLLPRKDDISSDQVGLFFTNEMILAHEFGHAYSSIKFGELVEKGSGYAIKMENAIRSRGTSKSRRTAH